MTSPPERQAHWELLRGQNHPARVLVVEDDAALSELLERALRDAGWDVHLAYDGAAALLQMRDVQPDVVILDILLPDIDGLEVLRRIRDEGSDVPVLFCTANDAVEDRAAAFAAGGNDYLTKPFRLETLLERLRVLLDLRATAAARQDNETLTVGDLSLDENSGKVTRTGQKISLTATEFELLRYLMLNPRRVLSRAQILDHVWHYDFGGNSNVVELYISYLRKKIDTTHEPMIHTVRGVGYVLTPAPK